MEKKTIAVRLKGGLGNQLFQYAAGRCLSQRLGGELLLLTDFLNQPSNNFTPRYLELDQFNLPYKLADDILTKQFGRYSFLQRLGLKQKPELISEQNFDSDSQNAGSVLLDGYFQSEKYFAACRALLLNEIKRAYSPGPELSKRLSSLRDHNSVAIHVRRGDYVSLKTAADFHGVLGMEYFNRAINFIKQREEKPRFFVYSDDPDWCRKNFPATDDFIFSENTGGRSAEDLILMSNCRHQIISNSSYSWWAAWLNENPDKKVIAPKNWYKGAGPGHEDIYCAGWVRL